MKSPENLLKAMRLVVFTLGDFYEVNPKDSQLANLTLCVASSHKIFLWAPPACHRWSLN
jgi:hypothetical protein